jgi:hypothetical protein
MPTEWKVQVISCESGEVVKELVCPNERTANRVDDGLNINLNHEKFYTLVVAPKETP